MPVPYRIGLLGLGHVGGALARRLVEDADRIATAAGRPIALEAIAVAHPQGRSAPAPLRPAKTNVKTFSTEGDCAQLGSVLVNEVTACQPGEPAACLDELALSSRVKAVRLYK